jgi:hypothetical protein
VQVSIPGVLVPAGLHLEVASLLPGELATQWQLKLRTGVNAVLLLLQQQLPPLPLGLPAAVALSGAAASGAVALGMLLLLLFV